MPHGDDSSDIHIDSVNIITFEDFVKSIKIAKSVHAFLDDGLGVALSAFADTNFDAAKSILKYIHLANDHRSQHWSVINHLEAAHQGYWKIYKGGFVMNWCNAAKLMDSATKDMYVYSYIDVIHKIFDERPLMTKWLKSACYAYNDRQVRTKDNASAVWGAFLSFFTNPMAGPNLLISWVSTRHLEVEEAHLKEFCKLMTGENWEISSYDNEAMLL